MNANSPKQAAEKRGLGKHIIKIIHRNLWWRRPLHRFYLWYLRESCGGDHHVGEYGPDGRYIVLMTEEQYNQYTRFARDKETP